MSFNLKYKREKKRELQIVVCVYESVWKCVKVIDTYIYHISYDKRAIGRDYNWKSNIDCNW